jgi:sugar phosphate isomerase/epimerase
MTVRLSAFPKCYLDQISHEKSMTVFDWIEMARELDCDGLEMYEGFIWETSPEYLNRLRDAIAATGRAMPMLCCSPDFTNPDPKKRQAAIAYQIEMVKVASHLGGAGTVCRVLSGQRYPEVRREDGLTWVAECIGQVLPEAKKRGITLGLENHYKDGHWRYPEFAQKMDVFLELLERIDERKYFGVQYDPSNAIVAGDDPIALLEKVAPRVVSMHASDRFLEPGHTLEELRQNDGTLGYSPFLKHGVTGKGLNDYHRIFQILASHGYRGWISIEDGMNGLGEMQESLKFLRGMVAHYFPASAG